LQVETNFASLNKHETFLLDAVTKLYVFIGSAAHTHSKLWTQDFAQQLNITDRNCKASVISVSTYIHSVRTLLCSRGDDDDV
jgi:hypothetical protein